VEVKSETNPPARMFRFQALFAPQAIQQFRVGDSSRFSKPMLCAYGVKIPRRKPRQGEQKPLVLRLQVPFGQRGQQFRVQGFSLFPSG
jgi:hypothetical protein